MKKLTAMIALLAALTLSACDASDVCDQQPNPNKRAVCEGK